MRGFAPEYVCLYPRLERAAQNQVTDGSATFGRYGIFIQTVTELIEDAKKLIRDGEIGDAETDLTVATDALSAFSEIQIRVSDPHLKD